jgi:hypothetical protein
MKNAVIAFLLVFGLTSQTSARAADPTCDQFKRRLVGAAQALQHAGLTPPSIRFLQQQDLPGDEPLNVFNIPDAPADADLYCHDGHFDSFDIVFVPIIDLTTPPGFAILMQFRYLVTAAIMAFTQVGPADALKSLDKLVAEANAQRDANIVLDSHAVMHLYGGDHFNFQINAADAVYGTSPGKQ